MGHTERKTRKGISGKVVSAIAVAVVCALGAPTTAQSAVAAPQKTPGEDSPVRQLSAEEKASSEAEESNRPVEVLSQRSETSRVFANPSGTFTQESYATAQWTRRNNKLVDINTNLKATSDGRISTQATTVGVSFSNGGSGPLARVVRDGRAMSLTWPAPLPKPVVADDTVLYSEVLPGVDLKLRADNDGFSQLLVVKTAQAAAQPELKTVALKMSADGLDISADAHGNLSATDPAGQRVFTAPAPRMWDSSGSPTPSKAARADIAQQEEPPPEADFEPGYGAQEAPIHLDMSADRMLLTPDQSLLTGEDTTYPVYIDPAVSGAREAWTIAYKKSPTSGYFNGAGWDGKTTNDARVGYENVTNGLARSIFRMDTNNLWNTKKQVTKSTFRIKNTWSWSCEARKVETWLTGSISASTNWNSQNNNTFWKEKLDTVNDSKGWGTACPGGNLAFDVTSGAKTAANSKWPNITLGLRAAVETDVYGWKKFDAKSAVLSTEYNTVPNVPSSLDTIPSSGGCDMVAPYTTIGNTDVVLTAKVSDADGGTVRAQFRLWGTNDLSGGSEIFNQIVSATSGTVARATVPKATLQKYLTAAKGNFGWKVQALDATTKSAWNPATTCRFDFDPTRPSTPPTISSQQFPDGSDGWPATTGQARTPGTFILGNGGVSDVTSYEYWTDWDPTVRNVLPSADLDGDGKIDAKLTLTPPAAGSQRLYVRSLDAAQNRSDRAHYLFYANGLAIPDKDGDLNGDGHADFYGVRTDGQLWLYPGQGNGYLGTGSTASNSDFDKASVTHRGDWTGDGFEDLIAAIPGDGGKTLQLYPNNGVGWACTDRNEQADGHSRSCLYDSQELSVYDEANNHWANADQILAIGDVDGPLDTDNDGTIDIAGYPDLLVKEGDLLWLYYGSASFYLDATRAPVLVGNGSWSNYDLVAPGDRTGNGHVDLVARHKTNGALRLYEGTGPAGEGLGNKHTVIGTGWTSAHRPLLTAFPDAGSDNRADIFATGSDDKLYLYSDLSGTGVVVGTSGWLDFQALS
ncbi:FG-GAP repeat domain-containing protein [Streptomyces halstedii]|uniref:FG-GAP repeat domain-containing protein n=1 Tax=Streptomyces halstedii TaxID=1944 RepID=UPI00378E9194